MLDLLLRLALVRRDNSDTSQLVAHGYSGISRLCVNPGWYGEEVESKYLVGQKVGCRVKSRIDRVCRVCQELIDVSTVGTSNTLDETESSQQV